MAEGRTVTLSVLMTIILASSSAFAESPRTKAEADCHGRTRREANERENAITELGVIAGKRHVEAQSAEQALNDMKRQHGYSYRNLTAAEQNAMLQLAATVDEKQRIYLLAKKEYLEAKIAEEKEQRRIKECLDDLADAEDARRAAQKSKSKTSK